MPVRIYDIAKKLGLENKDILVKAKALGISAAKVPSSALDKICAEYLEEELIKDRPNLAARLLPPTSAAVTSSLPTKPQIVISVTSAELYNLAERILNQEVQFRLSISETNQGEALNLCLRKDVDQKSPEVKSKLDLPIRMEINERIRDLLRAAYYASRHNSTDGWVNLAEYGNAVKKLDSNFQPQDFGERSLGSLLRRVADLFDLRNDETNPIVYHLRMKEEKSQLVVKAAKLISSTSPISVGAVPLPPKLAKGKVHNLRLGFGFIMPDDGTENLFFHATDVEGCTIFDLKPGDAVEYEPGINEKGPCGRKVRRVV